MRLAVGASSAPFSCARNMASVAVMLGVSTRIWNNVFQKASLMSARFWSMSSNPISGRPPVVSGWIICRPLSSTPP